MKLTSLAVAGLVLSTIVAGGAQGQPQNFRGGPDRGNGGTISGTVEIEDCLARPGDVVVMVDRLPVRAEPVAGRDSLYRYMVRDLPRGAYLVTPRVTSPRCSAGAWTPPARRVVIANGNENVSDVEFRFVSRFAARRIEGAAVAAAIQRAFTGTRIHLDNFTADRFNRNGRESWFRGQESSIRLGPDLGDAETRFTVPEAIEGTLVYYVNDLNANRVTARAQGDFIIVSFDFESRGTEIRGRCITFRGRSEFACADGPERSAPDAQIENARLDVFLSPARDANGRLTFTRMRVAFNGEVRARGGAQFNPGQRAALERLLNNLMQRQIRPTVEANMRRLLEQPGVRARLAASLQPLIDNARLGSITTLRMEAGDLVVEARRR